MNARVDAPGRVPRQLVAATALAPIAWVLHILVLPALVPYACDGAGLWSLHVTTAVLLVVALVGVASAHRLHREVRRAPGNERDPTFATVGLLLSWLFVALIVVEHIPVFVVDACSR